MLCDILGRQVKKGDLLILDLPSKMDKRYDDKKSMYGLAIGDNKVFKIYGKSSYSFDKCVYIVESLHPEEEEIRDSLIQEYKKLELKEMNMIKNKNEFKSYSQFDVVSDKIGNRYLYLGVCNLNIIEPKNNMLNNAQLQEVFLEGGHCYVSLPSRIQNIDKINVKQILDSYSAGNTLSYDNKNTLSFEYEKFYFLKSKSKRFIKNLGKAKISNFPCDLELFIYNHSFGRGNVKVRFQQLKV